MLKTLLLNTFISVCAANFAQKVIENPSYSATTADYVKITQIERQDTATIIDFEVEYFPGWWIKVSSDKTYIQSSQGGEKLFVTRAEGIQLNEEHWTPESGKNSYTLFFPPLDESIQTIDFREENWKIFDLALVPKNEKPFIPVELQGNWLRTDGSNEWVYGIYDDKVVYNNEIWKNILIDRKGKTYQLTLKNKGRQVVLFAKPKKGKLLISSHSGDKQLFSKEKTISTSYTVKNDGKFEWPVFKTDTTIYKGFIDGYHPKMGVTGIAYVNNLLTQQQKSELITIEPDGSFYCEIPMIYPQDVFIRMLNINESIYWEPGQELFQYIDLSEYNQPFKSYSDRKKRERKSLFMGEGARINAELQAMDSIQYFDYQASQKIILDASPEDYKNYCLDILKKEQTALSEFQGNNDVSKKAVQVKELQLPFRAYTNILSYNMNRESAYRQKHKIPRDQREIPLNKEEVEPGFYNFMDIEKINNPISLIAGSAYNTLINRIRFADCVRPKPNFAFLALKDSIKANNLPATEKEMAVLEALGACETSACLNEIMTENSDVWNPFYTKHKELFTSIHLNAQNNGKYENMKVFFGLENGIAREIMFSQSKCAVLRGRQKPFTPSDKNEIKNEISNRFIADYLLAHSDQMAREIERKLAENKTKTGFVVHETPDAKGDKLFETILEKYRGKLVFVDFWATWCGPCRSGMERMKPLKEELKDEPIEFVYITNPSSPVDTWSIMVPDIKGAHYRVEQDDWNLLASRFNISGIPHYVLVDQNGKVVENKIFFASSNVQLKELFKKYLEQ